MNAPDTLTLSPRAQAAVARLVEATIDSESIADDRSALTKAQGTLVLLIARQALQAVHSDLIWRAPIVNHVVDERWLDHYAQTVLRALVNTGLAERICQCKLVFPRGCPHDAAVGSRWCGDHYRSTVPLTYAAKLCPTCYAKAREVT